MGNFCTKYGIFFHGIEININCFTYLFMKRPWFISIPKRCQARNGHHYSYTLLLAALSDPDSFIRDYKLRGTQT
jgi:hypothetical protein